MSDRINFDKSFLSKELTDLLTSDAEYLLLDALYCKLHNDGYYLDGNTEVDDLKWFANKLFVFSKNGLRADRDWEALGKDGQKEWFDLARTCLAVIPVLYERIANRMKVQAQVLKSLEKTSRKNRNRRIREMLLAFDVEEES